mgnify:CR=1 FL=1
MLKLTLTMLKPLEGPPIRHIDDVTREYVEATLEKYPEVPMYRLAMEMGVAPRTLAKWLKQWDDGEDVIKDRR